MQRTALSCVALFVAGVGGTPPWYRAAGEPQGIILWYAAPAAANRQSGDVAAGDRRPGDSRREDVIDERHGLLTPG